MDCIIPGCTIDDNVYLEITCYRRILGGKNQFVKTREKDIICSHHHLIHNFAGILSLKEKDPETYNKLKTQTIEFLNSIPPDFRDKIVTVTKRSKNNVQEKKQNSTAK